MANQNTAAHGLHDLGAPAPSGGSPIDATGLQRSRSDELTV